VDYIDAFEKMQLSSYRKESEVLIYRKDLSEELLNKFRGVHYRRWWKSFMDRIWTMCFLVV